MAAILMFVLLLLCLLVLLLELRVRGSFTYDNARKSTSGSLEKIELGAATPFILVGFLVLVGLAIGVPMGSLAYWIATRSEERRVGKECSGRQGPERYITKARPH